MRAVMSRAACIAAVATVACGGGNGSTGTQTPVFSALTVSPPTASIAVTGTQQLTATPRDQNGSAMTGLPAASFTSANQSRATVSAAGFVTGVSSGEVRITASLMHGGTTRTGFSDITVTGGASATATVQAGLGTVFTPSSVSILRNGTVTWEWAGVEHNVTFATTAGAPANIANRSTGSESRTFGTLGIFNYSCTIHAGMNGEVRVVEQ